MHDEHGDRNQIHDASHIFRKILLNELVQINSIFFGKSIYVHKSDQNPHEHRTFGGRIAIDVAHNDTDVLTLINDTFQYETRDFLFTVRQRQFSCHVYKFFNAIIQVVKYRKPVLDTGFFLAVHEIDKFFIFNLQLDRLVRGLE
jgi:hypothetical protein